MKVKEIERETKLYGGRRDLEIWKQFQEMGIKVSRNLEKILSSVGLWRERDTKSFEAQWVMQDGGETIYSVFGGNDKETLIIRVKTKRFASANFLK